MTLVEAPVSNLNLTVVRFGPTCKFAKACSVSFELFPCVTASMNISSPSASSSGSFPLTVWTSFHCLERHTFAKWFHLLHILHCFPFAGQLSILPWALFPQ